MKKRNANILKTVLLLTAAAILLTGIADGFSRDTVFLKDAAQRGGILSYEANEAVPCLSEPSGQNFTTYRGCALLFNTIPLKTVDIHLYQGTKVKVGGYPFGVKLFTDGVIVVGFSEVTSGGKTCSPAYDAGLRRRDVITAVNGRPVSTAAEITGAVEDSGGKAITVTYTRDDVSTTVTVRPVLSDESGKYQTGLWIRDSTAGIGTVTFYMPDSNVFAGLGHGICDSDTGELLPLLHGLVTDVRVSGIRKGMSGKPGELKGYFSSGKNGSLFGNTDCGVFGIYTTRPAVADNAGLYEFGFRDEIQNGEATVICTLDETGPKEYSVELSDISAGHAHVKNFVVTVTDTELLQKTGGIVQGMSGSPIIQAGKLVGAVTHVLINDPTKGYGIFIENMLAKMPDMLDQPQG